MLDSAASTGDSAFLSSNFRRIPAIGQADTPPHTTASALRAPLSTSAINARNVRQAYGDKPMNVEIVAYGPGLKMFHADSTVSAGL